MLNIRLSIEQQTDHLVPPLEAGQGQCSVSVRLDLRVYVAAHVKQKLDCGCVAVHCSEHQRRDAQFAAGPRVNLGTMVQEELDDVDVSARCGQTERGVVGNVPMLLVRISGQEKLHHLRAIQH